MANPIQQFRKWLIDKRFFRVAWFAKDPQLTPEPEEALSQLPADLADHLIETINQLPVHPREEETVLQALKDAIALWKERPHATPNSIVILSDPVSSAARILASGLHQLRENEASPLPVKLLDWIQRPDDVRSIKQQVQKKLSLTEPNQDDASEQAADRHDSSDCPPATPTSELALTVIPNLCWCFLRSAEGLDGLDYLQDLLPRNPAQFWILGSGVVGWEYLKSTLQFHAYCGQIVTLPVLSGEELQSWLSPIIEQFEIRFPDAALHKRLQNPDSLASMDVAIDKPIAALSEIGQEVSATVQSSIRAVKDRVMSEEPSDSETSSKLDYFNRLAEISDGVSVVALQLFVKSLRYQKEDSREDCQEDPQEDCQKDPSKKPTEGPEESPKAAAAPDQRQRCLVATIPKLPPLPDLSQSDLYLLYSLLLHSDLTVRALAKSLGDAPRIVNNQVQILRNAGVIEQRGQVIKTNPMHYPELRRELAKNNFIIEVP
ncbi:MAG: hypothetical protein AAF152_09430 [Cyanobacteria bacterium P01_A01_bin.114]